MLIICDEKVDFWINAYFLRIVDFFLMIENNLKWLLHWNFELIRTLENMQRAILTDSDLSWCKINIWLKMINFDQTDLDCNFLMNFDKIWLHSNFMFLFWSNNKLNMDDLDLLLLFVFCLLPCKSKHKHEYKSQKIEFEIRTSNSRIFIVTVQVPSLT